MLQLLNNHANDLIHAGVVIVVVICVAVLAGAGKIDHNTAGNVFLAVVGYAAGRAGPGAVRSIMSRSTDPPPS